MQVLLATGLLLLNGLFVAAEFAVVAARRSQLEPAADAGDRRARITLGAMERVSFVLACAQLGITVCSLGLGAVAEPAVAHLLAPLFEAVNLPGSLVEPAALALALALVVYLHVALGEMVPKNLALVAPESTAVVLVPALVGLGRILGPAIWLLNAVANGLVRMLGVTPVAEVASAYTPEQLQSIVEQSHREGLLDDRHVLVTRAIQLGDRRARDVMVAWERVVTLPVRCTCAQLEEAVAGTGFSRFPTPLPVEPAMPIVDPARGDGLLDAAPAASRDARGAAWGYLHVQDLLHAEHQQPQRAISASRIRPLPGVDVDDDIEDVLRAMRRSGAHMARVTDATGQSLGAVFFEDLLEVLVGEVHDLTRPHELPH
jgi:CBS domain containing-hemolysin-like protein